MYLGQQSSATYRFSIELRSKRSNGPQSKDDTRIQILQISVISFEIQRDNEAGSRMKEFFPIRTLISTVASGPLISQGANVPIKGGQTPDTPVFAHFSSGRAKFSYKRDKQRVTYKIAKRIFDCESSNVVCSSLFVLLLSRS